MPRGARAHMHVPPGARTCCGPAPGRSQLPGGHRTLVGGAWSPCHPQHLCRFPGNPLPCILRLGPEGSLTTFCDLSERRALRAEEQISEGFPAQPREPAVHGQDWTARTLKHRSTFWKPRPPWTSASLAARAKASL